MLTEAESESMTVENVEDIFSQAEAVELIRHHVSDDTAHTFRIVVNERIINIKKSYVIWLLSSGRLKRSSDRLQRFRQLQQHEQTITAQNVPLQHVSTGDWELLSEKILCHVTSFKYKTGKFN